MNKVLFVVGPTASGKTKFAVSLASKFNGKLIGCDSVQVYKNLNIVSGKDIPQGSEFHKLNFPGTDINNKFDFGFYDIDNISVNLVDLVSPCIAFSVSDYIKAVVPVIDNICKEKFLPIVVGGTAFYVKALIDGIDTLDIPPNQDLRKNLKEKTLLELQEILKKEDGIRFDKMNESDIKNKRRLVRAIEIAKYRSKIKNQKSKIKKLDNFDILMIGLSADRQVIESRIDERVAQRLRDGAVHEAEDLFKNYEKLSGQVKNAVGYRQLFDYFLKKTTIEVAIDNWRKAEYKTAKKQMTFFKKDKRIGWFDITDPEFKNEVEKTVIKWLSE